MRSPGFSRFTARFTQDVLHFLEQRRGRIWLWEYLKPLQRRSIFKPLVIEKSPNHEDLHFWALCAQVHSRFVPRQALNVRTGYQQSGSAFVQPVYRLPQVARG
jgi:hypothetical protein